MTAHRDTVEVWLVDTAAVDLADLAAVLDAHELRRAEAISEPGQRHRFVVAHGAVRLIVAGRLGVPPAELRWSYGPHGKPELDGGQRGSGLGVNLSHSGGLAAVAVSSGRPVGVDVQRLASGVDPSRMAARWYPPDEARHVDAAPDDGERAARFAQLWARKEACVKATGGQLVPGLRLPVRGPAPVTVPSAAGGYLVHDLAAPPGFAAAVALAGTRAFTAVQRWWPVDADHDAFPVPDPLAVHRC